MTSPYEWGRKDEREQLGQLIKSVVEKRDAETLAKWYQTLGKALEIVKLKEQFETLEKRKATILKALEEHGFYLL